MLVGILNELAVTAPAFELVFRSFSRESTDGGNSSEQQLFGYSCPNASTRRIRSGRIVGHRGLDHANIVSEVILAVEELMPSCGEGTYPVGFESVVCLGVNPGLTTGEAVVDRAGELPVGKGEDGVLTATSS